MGTEPGKTGPGLGQKPGKIGCKINNKNPEKEKKEEGS